MKGDYSNIQNRIVNRDYRNDPTGYWGGNLTSSALDTSHRIILSRSGSSNTNFKKLIAEHKDASSAYSRVTCNRAFPSFQSRYTYPGAFMAAGCYYDHYEEGADPLGTGAYNFFDDAVTMDVALARCKSKLQRSTKEFNALVPLAELGELRGLIKQVATSAFTMTRGLVEIKHGKFRDAAKRASDLWLGWGFGVAPTLSDIQALTASVDAYMSRDNEAIKVEGSAHKTARYDGPYRVVTNNGGTDSFTYYYNGSLSWSYKYIGSFLPIISAANDYSIYDQLGFNFESLPAVGWELTPFSWVVDYFTTTGAFLEDVFSAPSVSTMYLVLCAKYWAEFDLTVGNVKTTSGCLHLVNPTMSPGYHYSHKFVRTPLQQLPSRSFRFKTVDEIGKHGVTKLLNLASILVR